jgi:hypothetical protein
VDLDLSKLLGGKSFTVPSQVAFNGYSIPMKSLADSGANGYLFIDTQRAIEAARFFGIPVLPLTTRCETKGFNGEAGTPISHAIILHLWVEGRRFLKVPMLITNLGQYDMIIGKNWFAEHDIWLDPRRQRLVWPEEQTPMEQIQQKQTISIPKEILKRPQPVNPQHQEDADRRDQMMSQSDAIVSRSRRYRPARTEAMDRRDNWAKMQRELQQLENPPPLGAKKPGIKTSPINLPKIDIAAVGAAAFHRHTRRKDTVRVLT